jgi:ribonuclease P protein component
MSNAPLQPTRPPRLRFSRKARVRQSVEFQRAMGGGPRATDGRLTVWAFPNDLPHTRLGLAVGKRHGGAVRRNRIKRMIREAFRLQQQALPGGMDLICVPRQGAELSVPALEESLMKLAQRLVRRLEQR